MQRSWHRTWNSPMVLLGASFISFSSLAGEPSPNSQTTTSQQDLAKAKQEREAVKEKLLTEMRALRMWRITEELKLDEATAVKIFPLLSRHEDLERQASKDRTFAMDVLKKSIEQGVINPAVLNPQLDRVVAARLRKSELDREKIEALRKILPPAGCAKLLVLLSTIDDEFRERIKRALPKSTIAPVPNAP